MAEPLIPTWTDLQCVIGLANQQATVVTPFYSAKGLEVFEAALSPNARVDIVTRLKLQDWSSGVADPKALLDMLQRFDTVERAWSMHVLPSLHAKSYVADRQLGLIGSSNLTLGGFENNVEIMLLVEAEEAEEAAALIDNVVGRHGTSVEIDNLQQWIERFEVQVRRARRRLSRAQRRLNRAQQDADALLGLRNDDRETVMGAAAAVAGDNCPVVAIPDRVLCDRFTNWLREHDRLAGASKLIENATDTVVGRNQGHFRRFFGSVWMFLNQEPQWRRSLGEWLAQNNADGYYDLPDDLRAAWIVHLNKHANINENDVCSYPLVFRYLPPRYGGTVTGGGGGVSTFKRMFPLVSEFLAPNEIEGRRN